MGPQSEVGRSADVGQRQVWRADAVRQIHRHPAGQAPRQCGHDDLVYLLPAGELDRVDAEGVDDLAVGLRAGVAKPGQLVPAAPRPAPWRSCGHLGPLPPDHRWPTDRRPRSGSRGWRDRSGMVRRSCTQRAWPRVVRRRGSGWPHEIASHLSHPLGFIRSSDTSPPAFQFESMPVRPRGRSYLPAVHVPLDSQHPATLSTLFGVGTNRGQPSGPRCAGQRPCRGGRGCTCGPRPCRSPGSPWGAWPSGITVAFTFLAICTLSCRIAIISWRL